jgi:penicillin-binding protein 1B
LTTQRERRAAQLLVAGFLLGSTLLVGWTVHDLERRVESRFQGPLFREPSRVYARPLVLVPGSDVERLGVEDHLGRLGYRRVVSPRVEQGQYHRDGRSWLIHRRAFVYPDAPSPGGVVKLHTTDRGQVLSLRDARGRRVDSLRLEPQLISSLHGESFADRVPVALDEVPEHLVQAILEIEDQRFFEHNGLDPRRVLGAFYANARAGRVVQGGSTLTQQLVKNFYLTPERSLRRKLREAVMAWLLERNHSKPEILEAYLNEIYLGQQGSVAIHGVGRAARYYFGKRVTELDVADSALLAGLIRGPSLYSPDRSLEAARARRDFVLGILHERGKISEGELSEARDAPLRLNEHRGSTRRAPYFVDYVAGRLEQSVGSEALHEEGVVIFTTLDMRLQAAAERAVVRGLEQLQERRRGLLHGAPGPVQGEGQAQAALVALDPRSGDILAMVGGRDYGESQFNRAADARRQPGSVFKPVVALAALSRGEQGAPSATLATMLDDDALSLPTDEGRWEPTNYDEDFRGAVQLRDALERSLNVPFARLGIRVGPPRVIRTARKLGISGRLRPVPSLALGAFEVSLLEITRAYAVLAAQGIRPEPRDTLAVVDAERNPLLANGVEHEQVFDPDETWLVTSALQGAVNRGTGTALRALGYRGPVAGKTGTTNEFRDAWFIGYTPELVAGVWVGFDDGVPIGMAGSRAALPIFADFLLAAVGRSGGAEFEEPAGLERHRIHAGTGLLASWSCSGEPEYFLAGTAPRESCRGFGWLATRRHEEERQERLADERHRRYAEGLPPEQRRHYEQWLRARAAVEEKLRERRFSWWRR